MKTGLVILQDEAASGGGIDRTTIAILDVDALIIMGHGSEDGAFCAGLNADDFLAASKTPYFWFHSCYCARELAPRIAAAGRSAFGFLGVILSDWENDPAVVAVNSVFEDSQRGTSIQAIAKSILSRLFKEAVAYLEQGDLLRAACLNNCRLTLRWFP